MKKRSVKALAAFLTFFLLGGTAKAEAADCIICKRYEQMGFPESYRTACTVVILIRAAYPAELAVANRKS